MKSVLFLACLFFISHQCLGQKTGAAKEKAAAAKMVKKTIAWPSKKMVRRAQQDNLELFQNNERSIKTFFNTEPDFSDPRNIVDLSKFLPDPGDQGNGNCCSSFAAAWVIKTISYNQLKGYSSKSITNFKRDKIWYTFSPTFTNKLASELQKNPCDKGASLDYAMQALQQYGSILLKDLPKCSDDFCKCNIDLDTVLITKAKKNAIWNRLVWGRVCDTMIWKAICDGKPVGFELLIPSNFYELGLNAPKPFVMLPKTFQHITKSKTLHSLVIVGFNRIKKLYKVVNSYGTNWGNGGFFYLPFSFFNKLVEGNAGFVGTNASIKFITINEKDPGRDFAVLSTLIPQDDDHIKEMVSTPFNEPYFISKGRYVKYGRLKIGCADIEISKKKTSLVLIDDETDSIITNFSLTGKDSLLIETSGYLLKFVQNAITIPPLGDAPPESFQEIYIDRKSHLNDQRVMQISKLMF